jgi:hypothetical protein
MNKDKTFKPRGKIDFGGDSGGKKNYGEKRKRDDKASGKENVKNAKFGDKKNFNAQG